MDRDIEQPIENRQRAAEPDRNGDHSEPSGTPAAPTASLSELDVKRAATGIL